MRESLLIIAGFCAVTAGGFFLLVTRRVPTIAAAFAPDDFALLGGIHGAMFVAGVWCMARSFQNGKDGAQ